MSDKCNTYLVAVVFKEPVNTIDTSMFISRAIHDDPRLQAMGLKSVRTVDAGVVQQVLNDSALPEV